MRGFRDGRACGVCHVQFLGCATAARKSEWARRLCNVPTPGSKEASTNKKRGLVGDADADQWRM